MLENKPRFGPEHFAAGTDIIRQGDVPDKFYIITRGQVEVVLQPPDGLDAVIDHLGPGDFFGEVGLLNQSRRMATVRAETAVDVMAMDYQTFRGWIEGSTLVARKSRPWPPSAPATPVRWSRFPTLMPVSCQTIW